MALRTPLVAVLALIAALYPLIIYLGVAKAGVQIMALILLCVVVLRMSVTRAWRQPRQYLIPVIVAALCFIAIIRDSASILEYYPVLMNLAFAAVFAGSLAQRRTLIEDIAGRLTDISRKSADARRYMRGLTAAWALLLCLNACVSAYTACCMTTKAWAVYNGFFAYVLMALFMAGELLFRHFYRKNVGGRHRAVTEPDQN